MLSDTIHNPDQYMSDLRQILTQGKKRIGLLLGAGAPYGIRIDKKSGTLTDKGEPLIPDISGLTAIVLERLDKEERDAISSFGPQIGQKPNIEAILSHTRLLATALGSNLIQGFDGKGYKALASKICTIIGDIVNVFLPTAPNPYTELVAWIGGIAREHPVEIFTPNYDLLIEEALERAIIPYFDGFSGSYEPFFDPASVANNNLPARWSRVWKIHGSLGWAVVNGRIVRGKGRDATQLIYPDHMKYDQMQKLPYTALFDRLKSFLKTPDSILVSCGFSYSDAHISSVIEEALATNLRSALVACQYNILASEITASTLAVRRPNVSIYAADGAVINGVHGKWQAGQPLNEEWVEIRKTFWGPRQAGTASVFKLGSFADFARFFALAQSHELARGEDEALSDDNDIAISEA